MRSGDALKAIAQAAYGDSSLWYLIADANGLKGDADLRVGQTLSVPTRVGGVHNSSATVGAYDPSRIVGSTNPQLPTPAGASGDACGIGQIVVAIIAVVVTIYTAGAAAEALAGLEVGASGVGGTFAAGLGALGSGTAAGIGASVVGGAVGSIVSQGVGIAIGAQDSFSWRQVGLSAIAAGVSSGVAGAASGTALAGTGVGASAARAALSSAATQGIGVAIGLQDHFSWSAVAASAIGAGISAGLNSAMDYHPGQPGVDFSFGKSLVSGIAGQTVAQVAVNGRVNATQLASGVFGSIAGDFLAASYGQQAGAVAGQGEAALQQATAASGNLYASRGMPAGSLATSMDGMQEASYRYESSIYNDNSLSDSGIRFASAYVPNFSADDALSNFQNRLGVAIEEPWTSQIEQPDGLSPHFSDPQSIGLQLAGNNLNDPIIPKTTFDASENVKNSPIAFQYNLTNKDN